MGTMGLVKKMIIRAVEKNTTCIHINAWDYKVLACKLADSTTQQTSYGFYVQTPEGEVSDRVMVKRSKFKGKNAMDWILDYQGDFDREDVDKMKNEFMKKHQALPVMDISSKLPIDEVYRELCEYAANNQIDDIVTIKSGYCNIEVKEFQKIVEHLDFGYKVLEIKKAFKELGLLRVNKGRPYDFNITDKDGNQYKTISFKFVMELLEAEENEGEEEEENNNEEMEERGEAVC